MYVVMAQFAIEPEYSQAFLAHLIAHARRSFDGGMPVSPPAGQE